VSARTRLACTAAALVPLAVLAAACSSSGARSASSSSAPKAARTPGPALPLKPASTPASLTETGSTLLFPLFGAWATAYQRQFVDSSGAPIVTITTSATDSAAGITGAATGTVDVGASDVYLSSASRRQHPGLINIALAISAQQINYNVPGVRNLRLDGAVLTKIYSGQITNWNASALQDLNPGVRLPDLKIVPLHRADSSGDTFLFTGYLNAQDPSGWPAARVSTAVAWPKVSGARAESGNSGMAASCRATKGCIAYIGISYRQQTRAAGLGTASLQNRSGNFVQPTSASIAAAAALAGKTPASEALSMINGPAASGYPIVNYEYAIVSTTQPNAIRAQDIRAFLYWAVHTGQDPASYLTPVGFQPLPSGVIPLSDNQIAKIGR
jgi:phosphate transport system substrate-binding protein